MKKCKVPGCSNDVFTHGYCYYHRYLYYNQKQPSLKKSKPKTKVRTFSKKKSLKKAKIAKSKKRLIEANGRRCFFCGHEFAQIDLAHIFPISLFEEYEELEWNHILACRKQHVIFDDGNFDDILKLPNIGFILSVIESVDEKYHYRLTNRGK
jgi:5-methylcytosine-specific restriction endonuclease McrA